MQRPDELDELLGAYALDAVDDDERAEVERYLAGNPRARNEVQQHREVATMLAFSGADAPEGLWDRIVGLLDEEAPAPGPELARVLPLVPTASAQKRPGRIGLAIGGAVAASLIAVLGYVAIDRGRQLDELRPQAVESILSQGLGQAMADPASAKVELASPDGTVTAQAVVEPNGVGYLAAKALPALPEDRTYQLWGLVGGKVISLGIMGNRPQILPFTVNGPLEALVITDEAAGGVPVSEQPAALVGELT